MSVSSEREYCIERRLRVTSQSGNSNSSSSESGVAPAVLAGVEVVKERDESHSHSSNGSQSSSVSGRVKKQLSDLRLTFSPKNKSNQSTTNAKTGQYSAIDNKDDLDEDAGVSIDQISIENIDDPIDQNPLNLIPNPEYKISYLELSWIIIITLTVLTTVDRFTTNLWPLWVVSDGPWVDNWSVSTFVVGSWISGRMMLVSSSVMFLTQQRVMFDWLIERGYYPRWLRVESIMEDNNELHWHTGWALLGLPVVLHVWSIIFPAWTFGASMKIYWSWDRPTLDNGDQVPFYEDGLLSLSINDVYRLISTSVAFFILIPISMWNYPRSMSYNITMNLHWLGTMSYTIDLIRMRSHPHCWFFNCPFILFWMIDRYIGVFYYKTHEHSEINVVRKQKLDDKTLVLYLNVPTEYPLMIGDLYYIKYDDSLTRAHPYTCFANHTGEMRMGNDNLSADQSNQHHKFRFVHGPAHSIDNDINNLSNFTNPPNPNSEEEISYLVRKNTESWMPPSVEITESGNDKNVNHSWNVGVLVNVYDKHDDCYPQTPFTKHLAEQNMNDNINFKVWGPYRTGYRLLCDIVMYEEMPPLILIGTGTGAAPLIDLIQFIKAKHIDLRNTIHMYFTTQSRGLFQYVTDILCTEKRNNLFVSAHLTQNDQVQYESMEQKPSESFIGRASFDDILDNAVLGTEVFFCGSPKLASIVESRCHKRNLFYHKGHIF